MLLRPPALLGRLPCVGGFLTKLVVPLTSDFRVQCGAAEWEGDVELTGNDRRIGLREGVSTAVIPAGRVLKTLRRKYGTSQTGTLLDGYESGYCNAERAVGIDPTVALVYTKGVPPDARGLAFASRVMSGGVTGPNSLVRLIQSSAAAPEILDLTRILMIALL
eukprot:5650357-Amphidinium_carterae.1